MILRRLAEAVAAQNWFTVLLEIFIVVAGIFIGLQVDDWNETRKERVEERAYLERMRTDVSQDIELLSFSNDLADERIEQTRFLEALARDPENVGEDPGSVIFFLEVATWESYLPVVPRTFEELRSSGLTTLIRDHKLRDAFSEYYRQIERWDSILELDKAREYFKVAVAGLLSSDQLVAIEDFTNFGHPMLNPDATLVIEIARQFSSNEEAIRWLPQMLKYHVLAKMVIAMHKDAAKALIRDIDAALDGETRN